MFAGIATEDGLGGQHLDQAAQCAHESDLTCACMRLLLLNVLDSSDFLIDRSALVVRCCYGRIGEMLVAEPLKSRNDVSQLPAFFGEMVLDPWRDFQESQSLHKIQLFQQLEPAGKRLGTDMPQRRTQSIKAHGTLQQIHDDQQHPGISQQMDGPSQRCRCTAFVHVYGMICLRYVHKDKYTIFFHRKQHS